MKREMTTLIVIVLLVSTALFILFNTESETIKYPYVEAPPNTNLNILLQDEIAQSVYGTHTLIKKATFFFEDCENQLITIGTKQKVGTFPESEIIYDTETIQLGTGYQEVTLTNFNTAYSKDKNYWFFIKLEEGNPVNVLLSDVNYPEGEGVYKTGETWNTLDNDIAFNIEWIGEEPEIPPSGDIIELTFSSDGSPADIQAVINGNLHSYELGRSYRIHQVEGTMVSPEFSGGALFSFAMAYSGTNYLGQVCGVVELNIGNEMDYNEWIDQEQIESNVVGKVFQTYFPSSYESYGTIYVTEDCRYWDTCE